MDENLKPLIDEIRDDRFWAFVGAAVGSLIGAFLIFAGFAFAGGNLQPIGLGIIVLVGSVGAFLWALIHCSPTAFVRVIEEHPSMVVRVYVHVEKTTYLNMPQMGERITESIVIKLATGRTCQFALGRNDLTRVLQALRRRLPHASFGYDEDSPVTQLKLGGPK